MVENNEYIANYPTWRNNDMSSWGAGGEYNNIKMNNIETYANQPFEGNSDELNYQNYLYSIVVDYYIHKDGLKHLKKSNSALL